MDPARDVALRHGRGKTRRLPNHPIREQTTAASAGHAQFFVVDIAALDHLIHAGHEIFVIVARVMVLNDVAEILAVSGAAARIRIQDHVTFCRHPLKFVCEYIAIGRVWAAMDIQDQWVFLGRIKPRWLLHPGLHFLAIETLIPNLFRLGQIELGEKFVVHVG